MKEQTKRLGVFDLCMIVISLILGMGIFRTPASVARDAGSPVIFFAAWVFGALIAVLGALTFAEIGSRFPRTGGSYKVLSDAYHPAFAFMVNWIQVISNAASIGAITLVGAGYLLVLLPHTGADLLVTRIIALTVVLCLFLISLAGLRMSALAQNILSLVKVGMVLVLCSAVFFVKAKAAGSPFFVLGTHPVQGFTLSLMGVFFTYEGYQWVINFGGETESPSRTIPRAILAGIGVILVLYLALNFTFYDVIGFQKLGTSLSPASSVAAMLFGRWGLLVSGLIIFISITGYAHAGMMSNPRMYMAMAADGVLPALFLKTNARTKVAVPVLCLFTGFILLSLVFADTFEKLLEYIILFDNIGLAAGAASIFILRKRKTGDQPSAEVAVPKTFRLRFYPLVPVLFLTALALVSLGIAIRNWQSALFSLLFFLAGWPLFYLLQRMNARGKAGDRASY